MVYNQPILNKTLGFSLFKLVKNFFVVRKTFENTIKNQIDFVNYCPTSNWLKLKDNCVQYSLIHIWTHIHNPNNHAVYSLIKWILPKCSQWNLLFLNFLFSEKSNVSIGISTYNFAIAKGSSIYIWHNTYT